MKLSPKDYFYISAGVIGLAIAFKQRYRLKFLESFLNGNLSKNPFLSVFKGMHNGINYRITLSSRNEFLIGGLNLIIKLDIKTPVSFLIYRKGTKPVLIDYLKSRVKTNNPEIDDIMEIRINNEYQFKNLEPIIPNLQNIIKIGFDKIKSDEYSVTLIKTINSDDEVTPELLKPALEEIHLINQKLQRHIS